MGIGNNIRKDPTRPGTIWACSGYQVLRTDGTYSFSKTVDDLPELDPQSDYLTTVIPANDGIAWVGSNQGLYKMDANSNTYQFYSHLSSNLPGDLITPLSYTSDGRIWFTNFQSTTSHPVGLYWFDGTQFGFFPVQDGGLPHAQIADVEIKENSNGYSLWISCLSRGIAVLNVVNNDSGINDQNTLQTNNHFQLYPNPAQTTVNIATDLEESITYEIFNELGQIIAKGITHNKTISLNNMESGLLFIRLMNTTQTLIETHKIIKL